MGPTGCGDLLRARPPRSYRGRVKRQAVCALVSCAATVTLVVGVTTGVTLAQSGAPSRSVAERVEVADCDAEAARVEQLRGAVVTRQRELRATERQVRQRRQAVRRVQRPRAERRVRTALVEARERRAVAQRRLRQARTALVQGAQTLADCRAQLATATAEPSVGVTPEPTVTSESTATVAPEPAPAPGDTATASATPTPTPTPPPTQAPTQAPTAAPPAAPVSALQPLCDDGLLQAVCDAAATLPAPEPGDQSPLQALCDTAPRLQPLCDATAGLPDAPDAAGASPLQPLCDAGLPQAYCDLVLDQLPESGDLPPLPGLGDPGLPGLDVLIELLGAAGPRPR